MNRTFKLGLQLKLIIILAIILLLSVHASSTVYAAYSYSQDQMKVLEDINTIRNKTGLNPVAFDESLTRAAVGHSIYLFANDEIGHEQTNELYSTQQKFSERIEFYTGNQYHLSKGWYMIAEDVDYRSPHYAIRDLVEAPYHRYPILHPNLTHIGVGTIGYHNTVVTFGLTESTNYLQHPVLYPYNNETSVLLSQKVFENPDPFYDTPMTQEEAGYVLSIFTGVEVFSTSLNISLYDEHKNPIKFIVKSLTPKIGSDFWIVIPIEKLKPLTTYEFKVNNSVSKFTTMSEEQFTNWNVDREDEFIPYDSKPAYFDQVIAATLNPELNITLTNPTARPDEVTVTPRRKLPTSFQQLGFNRDNVGIYLNDDYITLSPTGKINNNRTFIPLRGLLEQLNAIVDYNSVTKEITITQDNLTIKLLPNSKVVSIIKDNNILTETLDSAPFIEDGTTYVPLRFLSVSLGADIIWDQLSYTVGIAY